MKVQQIRQWTEGHGRQLVHFKATFRTARDFTFDAWNEAGRHVGVHSPHAHRPYFHLQIRLGAVVTYEELPAGEALRFYAQVFERAVRKVFKVNAWKVFS